MKFLMKMDMKFQVCYYLSEPIIYTFLLMPKYFPFPQPTSTPINPG